MMTQQHTHSAQRNVESDALFPNRAPVLTSTEDPSDDEERAIERGYDQIDVEQLLENMFGQYAAALQEKEYATPQPIYKEMLDETGMQFVLRQTGEKDPAIYEMYDTLVLYARGSIIGGTLAINPDLFNGTRQTIDQYIEAYVQDGIQRAIAERSPNLAQPAHISTIEAILDDETNVKFLDTVKKITGKTLNVLGINSPIYHSAPTDIVTKVE